MEKLVITHESAAMYWRAFAAGVVNAPALCYLDVSEVGPLSRSMAANLRLQLPFCSDERLNVAYFKTCDRRKIPGFAMHLCDTSLPDNAFYEVSEDVLVASPALTLVQLASTERHLPLMEYAMELCGTYTLVEGMPRGTVAHPPFARRDELASEIEAYPRIKGRARALEVLAKTADGSASPRESQLFLLMTLPKAKGGFGLEKPVLAKELALGAHDRRLTSKKHFIADMIWPARKVIAEYDGDYDHSKHRDVVNDKSRRSVLAALGYKVIVFTNEDMKSVEALTQRMRQLGRLLGVRMRAPRTDMAATQRARLLSYLASPGHLSRSPATRALDARFLPELAGK